MSETLLKLVLDTATIVSAFFWEGNEAVLFKKIEQGKARLSITQEILDEIYDVVKRPKFNQVMCNAGLTSERIIEKIISVSELIVSPDLHVDVCRDEKDNKFLECAENSKADYIISGDEDLLSLKRHKNIPIVRSSEILKFLL